ncbi:tyrosine-type recombinase/integrase [Pseudoxanthomonas winnipegensis]|uniref:tyrosine-type recombinase/integrase n=1 Tax=Pseudoxanthomonas winnipegensis TaxID=2480810 RepID=UPI00102D80AD|nr:site-specific integrase [Pseudoxanthomonas winnipegensis]RZZ81031.1 site-specific integrase [Pseudoxanthomonas winnipegensis]TAA42148.1 site-specific integrase [Pseudoxanthomonas winnipegensis]TBV69570.1 site-specific integrase [Pseudoxanthomonas winnipegensis]
MASIKQNGKGYRVQLYVAGVRDSKTFDTRKEAAQWALEREAELRGKRLPDKTLLDAMRRYARDEAPKRAGEKWELLRLTAFERLPMARRRVASLTPDDFSTWRDDRLKVVKPGSVARDMTLMRGVLEAARRDWRWIRDNPMKDVRWPQSPPGRARRIMPAEEEALRRGFGVWDDLPTTTVTNRVGLAFIFALETAMRSGEILALTWPNIHLSEQYVRIPTSKNGEARDVPLTKRACQILDALPRTFGPVFDMDAKLRDAMWRKVRDRVELPDGGTVRDIHFHDSRAEAIWRLSKKLDVLQLARMIGHRDLKSLMHYYNESASSMARQLG